MFVCRLSTVRLFSWTHEGSESCAGGHSGVIPFTRAFGMAGFRDKRPFTL